MVLEDGQPAKVVGLGLFPSDVHAQFDEGASVSNDRWFALLAPDAAAGAEIATPIAVRFEDGADVDEEMRLLGEAVGDSVSMLEPVDLPAELTNLHFVQRLPNVIAVVLTVLGIVALGHGLFSTVRHRRKDFAILRALGVSRGGSRLILAAQASTIAVVGLVLGVPIGLLAGRAGWQAITDRVPLTYRSPFAFVAVALVVPLAFIAANALAFWPGRRTAKLHPATLLRAE